MDGFSDFSKLLPERRDWHPQEMRLFDAAYPELWRRSVPRAMDLSQLVLLADVLDVAISHLQAKVIQIAVGSISSSLSTQWRANLAHRFGPIGLTQSSAVARQCGCQTLSGLPVDSEPG